MAGANGHLAEPFTVDESTDGMAAEIEFLRESIADLQLALEDADWERVFVGSSKREFSRDALRKLWDLTLAAYLKNPLINRAIELQKLYVFGQGVGIRAVDERANEVLQDFVTAERNKALLSQEGLMLQEVDLATTGNLFWAYFVSADGRVTVRSIPAHEIVDIFTDPDDSASPWYYLRRWRVRSADPESFSEAEKEAWLPDWRVERWGLPQRGTLGGKPVLDSPLVHHVRVGGTSDMKFGIPEVYSALDWARAYKRFLEDWATLVASLSKLAWKMTVKGGAQGVAAAKTRLNRTPTTPTSTNTNPPSVAGSTFVASEGYDMAPMPKSGATISADDGRRLLLMVAAATGLPETFFGDVSVGTLATAKSLDRPTELKFRNRQLLWEHILADSCSFAIQRAILAKVLPGDYDVGTGRWQLPGDAEETIEFSWPPILEHDVTESVTAVVDGLTLKGNSLAMGVPFEFALKAVLTALGVDDVDAALDEVFPKDADGNRVLRPDENAALAQALAGVPPEEMPEDAAGAIEAVRKLSPEDRNELMEILREMRTTAEALAGQ